MHGQMQDRILYIIKRGANLVPCPLCPVGLGFGGPFTGDRIGVAFSDAPLNGLVKKVFEKIIYGAHGAGAQRLGVFLVVAFGTATGFFSQPGDQLADIQWGNLLHKYIANLFHYMVLQQANIGVVCHGILF